MLKKFLSLLYETADMQYLHATLFLCSVYVCISVRFAVEFAGGRSSEFVRCSSRVG
jgi:hypothetical protein